MECDEASERDLNSGGVRYKTTEAAVLSAWQPLLMFLLTTSSRHRMIIRAAAAAETRRCSGIDIISWLRS